MYRGRGGGDKQSGHDYREARGETKNSPKICPLGTKNRGQSLFQAQLLGETQVRRKKYNTRGRFLGVGVCFSHACETAPSKNLTEKRAGTILCDLAGVDLDYRTWLGVKNCPEKRF